MKNKIALIITENRVGYGNVSFAIKLAHSLKKIGYDSYFLLTGDVENDQKALEKFNTKIPCVTEVPKDCSVCFAAIDFSVSEIVLKQLKGKKIIVLSQYDMEVDRTSSLKNLESLGAEIINTGIAPNSEGVFLQERLFINPNEKENFSAYQELTDQTLYGILFKEMKNPLEYPRTRSLSLAYTSDYPSPRIAGLHAYYHDISENRAKHYDLIIINTKLSYESESLEKYVIKNIPDIFGKITIFCLKTQEEKTIERPDIIEKGDTREFRIILTESVPYTDMLAIHKMIGKKGFRTITGDQSLIEATSIECAFYYICQPWKKDLFSYLKKYIPSLDEADKNFIEDNLKTAATIIHENQEHFISFCKHIRKNKNLESTIANLLQPQQLNSTLPKQSSSSFSFFSHSSVDTSSMASLKEVQQSIASSNVKDFDDKNTSTEIPENTSPVDIQNEIIIQRIEERLKGFYFTSQRAKVIDLLKTVLQEREILYPQLSDQDIANIVVKEIQPTIHRSMSDLISSLWAPKISPISLCLALIKENEKYQDSSTRSIDWNDI